MFPPILPGPGPRPNDLNNFAPRLGFAYSTTDRTVIRGGFGKYYAEVTGQPAVFTLRNVQQINPLITTDGRADFASNPFNGPAPTYDQAAKLLCAVSTAANCLRPSVSNFVAPDLVQPFSYQASIGVARQLGTLMSFEADYVFQGNRDTLRTPNINTAYNPATGANYRFTGSGVDPNRRVYPYLGSLQVARSDGKDSNHALQTSFTRRMSNRWQVSATYTLQKQYNFDSLPLNPECKYPMTITGTEPARCDVPITLAPDIAENDWYLAGDQRQRITFNGIWQLPYDFQLSGLWLFGDNGKNTPSTGVDVRQLGGNGSSVGGAGQSNANAWRLRADGTLIARNTFDRTAISRVDLRVQRRFRVIGKTAVDGIFEMYNVFNRSNFNLWVTDQSNAKYGQQQQDTNLAYAPRMLQLGFRATF